MKQTIGIADDHLMFRKGLIEIINLLPKYEVILEAGNGDELLKAIDLKQPDILIIDLKMPGVDGYSAIKIIKENHPNIKLLVLSMHDQEKFILHAFQLGVHGYLPKNSGPKELESALNSVISDGFYFTDRISKILADGLKKKAKKPLFVEVHITEREREILILVCAGLSNDEIGNKMFLSKRTVEWHRKHLLIKADVKNTAGLVAWAFRLGLAE